MSKSIEKVQEMASAWDAHEDALAVDADFVIIFGDWIRGREQIVNDS